MNPLAIFLFHKTDKKFESFGDVKSVMDFINLSRAGAGWWTVIAHRGTDIIYVDFEDAHSLVTKLEAFVAQLPPEVLEEPAQK